MERVLRAVEQVPRGRLVSYGDIAALVGVGPRQVGSVLRHWGGNVTWWRVTNASGDLPAPLREQARRHWAAEGILPKRNGLGARMADYRADLSRLAGDWDRACADLAGAGAGDGDGDADDDDRGTSRSREAATVVRRRGTTRNSS